MKHFYRNILKLKYFFFPSEIVIFFEKCMFLKEADNRDKPTCLQIKVLVAFIF
jgi:hypothetical protein